MASTYIPVAQRRAQQTPKKIRRTLSVFTRKEGPQPHYWHATLGNGEIVANGEEYEHRGDMIDMLEKLFGLTGDQKNMLAQHGHLFDFEEASA